MPARFCEPFSAAAWEEKIASQRIAGSARETEALYRQVKIEIVDPLAVLHGIDNAQSRLNPQHAEVLDERHVMRLERRLIEQEFDTDPFALRRHALAVLDHVAGVLQ